MPPKRRNINAFKSPPRQGKKSLARFAGVRTVRSTDPDRVTTPGQLSEEGRARVVRAYLDGLVQLQDGRVVPINRSFYAVAQFFKIDKKTVKRCVERFESGDGFAHRPIPGRPRIWQTDSIIAFVQRTCLKEVIGSVWCLRKRLQVWLNKKRLSVNHGNWIPRRSMRDVMRRAKLMSKVRPQRPGLTEAHKEARRQHAERLKDMPADWWLETAFGDGTPARFRMNKRQIVNHNQDPLALPKWAHFSQGHLWGAMRLKTNWRTEWIHPPKGRQLNQRTRRSRESRRMTR